MQFSYYQYFFYTADTCNYHCLPKPVRQYKSYGNRRAGDCSYGGEYGSGGDILPADGPLVESVRTLRFCGVLTMLLTSKKVNNKMKAEIFDYGEVHSI